MNHQATRSPVAVGCKVKGQPRCHVLRKCSGSSSKSDRDPKNCWPSHIGVPPTQPVERTLIGTYRDPAHLLHHFFLGHPMSSWVYLDIICNQLHHLPHDPTQVCPMTYQILPVYRLESSNCSAFLSAVLSSPPQGEPTYLRMALYIPY